MTAALAALGTLVLLAAYGMPWVVATGSLAPNARAAAVALLGGVADLGLLTLVLMQLGLVNRVTVLVGAGVALAVAEGLRRAAARYGRTAGAEGGSAPAREGWIELAVVAVLVAVALWARRQPVNFVFQTGDMGEYVNNANLVARGQRLGSSFPHIFATLLSATRSLFGFTHTAAMVPALSAASVVVVVALVRRWGGSLVVAALGGLVMAVSPFAVWFGAFPVSEAMMATVLLGTFFALVAAVRSDDHRVAAATAVFAGGLLGTGAFVRGTGVVFAVLPVLALVFLWDGRREVRRCVPPFAVAAASLIAAGVVYNFASSKPYMDGQFRNILGEGFPTLPLWVVAGASVLFVVVVVVAVVVLSGPGERTEQLARWLPAAPGAALVGLLALHLAVFDNSGLIAAIDAFGWPVLLAAAVGLVALVVPGSPLAIAPMVGVQMVGLAAIGSLLYAHRIPEPLNHSYYLYWERYAVSEVYPVVVALAMAGLVLAELAVLAVAGRLLPTAAGARTAARWVVGVGAVLAGIGTVLWSVPQIRETNRFEFFGGTDDVVERLAEAAGDDPVIYTGTHPTPWFFPNTFRAFALPLQQSLGVTVANIGGRAPFEPDPDLTLTESADLARSAGLDEVVVVSAGPAATTDPLRRECQRFDGCTVVEVIEQPVRWRINNADGLDPWRTSELRFTTFRLDTGDTAMTDAAPPPDAG